MSEIAEAGGISCQSRVWSTI